MVLRISLLGQFQLTYEGDGYEDRFSPRARNLLVHLLLIRDRPSSRRTIAFTLFPDSTETRAMGSLRRALSELRSQLPTPTKEDWVLSTREELRWNPDAPIWLDVDEFDRLVKLADTASLHEAVSLYAGDLLPMMDFEWLIVERERLRLSLIMALGSLLNHHRGLGEFEAARSLALQRVTLDPLSESAYRDLIALYYLSGDRASALAAYRRLESLLDQELGVAPMAETQAMVKAIRAGEDLVFPSTTPDAPILKGYPSGEPLVGRQEELAMLHELWEGTAETHGRLVVLGGEPGVGKTHFVLSWAREISDTAPLVSLGNCHEYERTLPYQALITMLQAAEAQLTYSKLSPNSRRLLAKVAPGLFGVAPTPERETSTSQPELRFALFEAIHEAFLCLAGGRPGVLIFEDVHWASEATLDWLTYLTPRLTDCRLLILTTYRTGELRDDHALLRLRRRYSRDRLVSQISLKPLSKEANRALVGQMSGLNEERVMPVADRLYARTSGNPFFLKEVVRGLIDAGRIVTSDRGWSGKFLEAEDEQRMPLTEHLRETVGARVARLPSHAAEFARGAAVCGQTFEYESLKDAGGWAEEAALQSLEELLGREIIRVQSGDKYAFVHHLVQEAIYAQMPVPRQAHWHRRIGAAMEKLHTEHPSRIGELAHHFYRGGEWSKAVRFSELAAKQAEASHADPESAKLFTQALEALARVPGDDHLTRFMLLTSLLSVEERLGEYEPMLSTLAELEQVARSSSDRRLLAKALLSRGRFLRIVGPLPQALRLLEDCVAHARALDNPMVLAQALAERGQVYLSQLHENDGLTDLRAAIQICERHGHAEKTEWQVLLATTLRGLGDSVNRLGRFQEALQAIERSLEVLRTLPKPPLDEVALSLLEKGYILNALGASSSSLEAFSEGMQVLREIDLRGVMVEAHLLEEIFKAGTSGGPLAELRQATQGLERAGRWQSRPDVKGQRLANLAFYSFFMEGRPDLALEDMEQAIDLFEAMGNQRNVALAHPLMTYIHMALEDVPAALRVSERGLEMLAGHESYAEPHIAVVRYQALMAAGRRDEARPFLESAYRLLTRRIESIDDPELRKQSYQYPGHAMVIETWRQANTG